MPITSPPVPVGNHVVTVTTGNGHGSTNTKIRRFTTAQENVGSAILYSDSAANGATFTIAEAGMYEVYYNDQRNGGVCNVGVSLNSAQLTTNIESITAADRKAWLLATATNLPVCMTRVLRLAPGDVICAHTDGTPNVTTPHMTTFSIRKVGNV